MVGSRLGVMRMQVPRMLALSGVCGGGLRGFLEFCESAFCLL